MRFHKAIQITGPEAMFLIQLGRLAAATLPVVSFDGVWYDVRSLSAKELEGNDLLRIRLERGFTTH
jgi:hypothetical protein